MSYLGDFTPSKTVVCRFNTHQADGTPITLAGTPAVSAYKNSTTESTSGITLTVDYDARTGLHSVAVDTSADGTFYAAGNDFDLVITAGTVDTISVVGTVVGTFSLSNRSALRPGTADRTLTVDSSGVADANVANWNGTAVATPDTAGYPKVTIKEGTSTGELYRILTQASSSWEASAAVKSLGTAVMMAVHKTTDNAGTLETYRSDGTTLHSSATLTTDAAKQPIATITGQS